MGMRGSMDMKGGNYRGNNDNWSGNSGVYSIHMRGLPFKATEQDIADVILIINNNQTTLLLRDLFSICNSFFYFILFLVLQTYRASECSHYS